MAKRITTPVEASTKDLERLLLSIPDLSAALASDRDDELLELFEAFDLQVRYDKRSHSAEISIALIPELLEGLAATHQARTGAETTRPATGAGQCSRLIAGGRI